MKIISNNNNNKKMVICVPEFGQMNEHFIVKWERQKEGEE